MADIYKQRFAELNQQMEVALASKRPEYNEFLGGQLIEIESNTLLEWKVKARNLLSKACGPESEHFKEFLKHENPGTYETNLSVLETLKAIFLAAREDYEGGYMRTTRSLVQADVFGSELEQAQELRQAGYKSPAAVVAGIVLETSLRELCDRNGIAHAKLDKMNADLTKAGVYNAILQKRITALAGIRNAAAHGEPEKFTDQDVDVMIRDVERFIADHL